MLNKKPLIIYLKDEGRYMQYDMQKIWRELYGYQSNDFINGVIAGIEMYTIWKNGKQVVGVQETPLAEVIEEVKQQLGYNLSQTDAWLKDKLTKLDWIKPELVEICPELTKGVARCEDICTKGNSARYICKRGD
jgi:hypothetical protein